MKISSVTPYNNHILKITMEEGKTGYFDISPYLESEVFSELKDNKEFERIYNGGYFIEWDCGADLSSDTISAHLFNDLDANTQPEITRE